jgi:hypothetical protein
MWFVQLVGTTFGIYDILGVRRQKLFTCQIFIQFQMFECVKVEQTAISVYCFLAGLSRKFANHGIHIKLQRKSSLNV